MYNNKIMERFMKPIYVGEMKDADAIGEVGNVKCGDIMRIYIKIGKNEKDEEIIKDIKFKTYGCVTAIVATDFLCEMVLGMKLEDAAKITGKDIATNMGDVPEIKFHCSILAQNALRKAIEEHKKEK